MSFIVEDPNFLTPAITLDLVEESLRLAPPATDRGLAKDSLHLAALAMSQSFAGNDESLAASQTTSGFDGEILVFGEEGQDLAAPAFTLRFANEDDIGVICDMRQAQLAEYWQADALDSFEDVLRLETELYLRRNLNERVLFALVESEGKAVCVSGLEIADRMPTIGPEGKAQRSATVVACYTAPDFRGSGLMGRMLDMWSVVAPLLGIEALYLETHNASMQHMAQSRGFGCVSSKYRLSLS